jgi:hypothetical protein
VKWIRLFLLSSFVLALFVSTGCSIKLDGEFAVMKRWSEKDSITKETKTSVPAQPAQVEHVDTQEVKVNEK